MRYLRKLLLPALAAMAAMVFMGSTASAQESVEVRLEPAGGGADTHCQAAGIFHHVPSTGNCRVRAVSESPSLLFQHTGASEVLFSTCDNMFEAVFNEDGVGAIYNQGLTAEGGACGREPCDEGAGTSNSHRNLAWPAEFSEPVGGVNQENIEVDFCLYAHSFLATAEGTAGTTCNVTLAVTRVAHTYEVTSAAHDGAGNGATPCANLGGVIELEGHWVTETNVAHPNNFEIVHHS